VVVFRRYVGVCVHACVRACHVSIYCASVFAFVPVAVAVTATVSISILVVGAACASTTVDVAVTIGVAASIWVPAPDHFLSMILKYDSIFHPEK